MSLGVHKRILIAGATGSIGGALALVYAAAGVELQLHGRDVLKLGSIGEKCRVLGATVILHPLYCLLYSSRCV